MDIDSVRALRALPPEEVVHTKSLIAKKVMDDAMVMYGLLAALEIARVDLINVNEPGVVALSGLVEAMRTVNEKIIDGVELLEA